MTSWKELTSARKSTMSIIELAVVLMGFALLTVVILGYKALDTSHLIHEAESTMRMAGDQLDEYTLNGNAKDEQVLQMLNLKSLSPLPTGKSWEKSWELLTAAQSNMTGVVQSKRAYQDLHAKAEAAYTSFETVAKGMIDKNQSTAIAQDVLLSAQSIRDWMNMTPQDADLHQIESKYLTEKINIADSLLGSKTADAAVTQLRTNYDAWMESVKEQLMEEKNFVEQKKMANTLMASLAVNVEEQTKRWLSSTKLSSQGFVVLFALLIGVIIFSLQALKKNPHLNTMFATKGPEVLQTELEAVTAQVDQILANVDKAWMDSRSELKVVHHAIEDSEVLESQVQQLKTDMGTVVANLTKGLQDLEHKLRATSAADADKVGALLSDTQVQGSKIHQSLEVLVESGISIHDELQQVRKTIKRLMTETLALKHEGEVLEESSEALRSA